MCLLNAHRFEAKIRQEIGTCHRVCYPGSRSQEWSQSRGDEDGMGHVVAGGGVQLWGEGAIPWVSDVNH